MKIPISLALAGALAACSVADAAPPPMFVEVQATPAATADSACFGIWWPAVEDSLGAAESYVVEVTSSDTVLAPHSRWTVTDHQTAYCLVRPAPADSVRLGVFVSAVRRGITGEAKGAAWVATTADQAPPAPDSVVVTPVEGAPPVVVADPPSDVPPIVGSALFAEPRDTSPHFDYLRRTFTDYCGANCWAGTKGAASRAYAAKVYDLFMSGDQAAWKALNPTSERLRYALLQTTFTEEADTAGRFDPNSLTGQWQYDARAWYAAHPQYNYESLWLHDRTATPTDSASRIRFLIWANYRYAVNPLDPGALAYTVDRLRRAKAEVPAATGLFLDEMDRNAWRWLGQSREGAGMDTTTWHAAVVNFVRAVRDSLGFMTLSNAAAYSPGQFDAAIGHATRAMDLERMNTATGEMTKTWAFVDGLVRDSVYVSLVNLESFSDFARYKPTFFPPGNYADAVGRGEVFQLASYYMVVDSLARLVGLHENYHRYPLTPDSTDLRIYYLDVGHAKAPRYVWQSGTDALGQAATIYRRDFTNAVVLARPITSYRYPTMTDTTAVPVALPEGSWSMVKARGDVVPLDSLKLRNSEAVILIRRQ